MKLTDRQGFCLMTAFLLGNVLSGIGGASDTEKIGYLAILLSLFLLVVLIGIYRVILKRNGYCDFFELFGKLFGKTGGKIALILVAAYSFFSAFLSIANYLEFVKISTCFRTPEVTALVVVLLLTFYFACSREKAMGRYSEIVLPIVLAAVVLLILCGWKEFQVDNFILPSSIKTFSRQGLNLFFAPFSEIIFVYLMFGQLKNRKNVTKIALASAGTTTLIFSGLYLFNLLILGQELLGTVRFPTFYTASVVQVGTVIEKAETLITFSYTFCDLLYSGVCLFLGIKAINLLFGKKKYVKKITAVIAVIFFFILILVLRDTAKIEQFFPIATVIMIPFTVGLPLLMLLTSLRKKPNKEARCHESCNNGDSTQ